MYRADVDIYAVMFQNLYVLQQGDSWVYDFNISLFSLESSLHRNFESAV